MKSDAMKKKTCLITGANSGIGYEMALALADHGAAVVLWCRDTQKAEAAREKIIRESGNTNIDLILADMGELDAIRAGAAAFMQKHQKLHVLINNAGLMMSAKLKSSSGFEKMWAVNFLGPCLLTRLLLEYLKKSAPARVINVSSAAHQMGRISFDRMDFESAAGGFQAYANSKLALNMFTYELARRLEGTDVTVNAFHPGVAATHIGHGENGRFFKFLYSIASPFFITAKKGAETGIHLAMSPEMKNKTGGYYVKMKLKKSSPVSYREGIQEKLWKYAEKTIKFANPAEKPLVV